MKPIDTAQAFRLVLACLAAAGAAAAETPLDSVTSSPDVTVELGTTDELIADEDAALDEFAGSVVPVDLGALPAASDLSGYERLADGDALLCFDTTVELPGFVLAEPGDVVRFDGTSYSLEFDASLNGLPPGAFCDAVTVTSTGVLELSFDTTVSLPGSGGQAFTAADEDLVAVQGPALFALVFDGSAAGVPEEADLDGADALSNGNLGLSFDVSGSIDGIDFDDEDVLEYAPDTASWSPLVDSSAEDLRWAAADLDGLALARRCVGDATGDGITGTPDFVILSTNFGTTVPPGTLGDVTGDGVVGTPDFVILSGDFGCTP